jgi:hypothetical protein
MRYSLQLHNPSFHNKRLHVHSLPFVLATIGLTGILMLTAQLGRGDPVASAMLKPALGVSARLFANGHVQAGLRGTSVVDESAGVADKLSLQGGDSQPSVISIDRVGRALGVQMALESVTKSTR